MKRSTAMLVLFLAVFLPILSGCSAVKKPDIDGLRSYLKTKSIITEAEYGYDETTGIFSVVIYAKTEYDLNNPSSAANHEYESAVKLAEKYNIPEITVKVSVLDADDNVLYSETDGKDDEVTRMENFNEYLRKINGAFDVSTDDPLAGEWVKDESSGFSILFPDRFTYGDVGSTFATDGLFTFDGGKTLHEYHISPDGSRLIVDNGFNENVIYRHQE